MTISRIGHAEAEANTLVTPAGIATGDLFLAFGYRIGSQTPAIVAPNSSWAVLSGPTGANGINRVVACKWASSSSDTFGVFTNAQYVQLLVYRGSIGPVVPGAVASVVNGTSSALSFALLGLRQPNGNSWVAASAAISTTDTDLETPPAGLTLVDNLLGTSGEVSIYDTAGGVSSFPATSRTLSGTAGNLARIHVELLETVAPAGSTIVNGFPRSRLVN